MRQLSEGLGRRTWEPEELEVRGNLFEEHVGADPHAAAAPLSGDGGGSFACASGVARRDRGRREPDAQPVVFMLGDGHGVGIAEIATTVTSNVMAPICGNTSDAAVA